MPDHSPPSAGPAQMPRSLPHWLLPAAGALCVFAVGAALYAATAGFPFLNWDDPTYVLENPAIRGFSVENLRAIFSQPILGGWLPVHLLSYAFDFSLWGLDPTGYHLHSLLLNALNGALAFLMIRRVSGRDDLALVAALLFAVHPSYVESVAWVSSRKDLLFTTFLLLSTLAYLHARRARELDRRAYLTSLLLFSLGLLSKTTISVYPAFFLLLDLHLDAQRPDDARRALSYHLKTKLPFLAVAVLVVGVNLMAQVTATDPLSASLRTYALVKGMAAWRYLTLLLGIRFGQPIYDPPAISLAPVAVLITLAPLVLMPLAAVYGWWRRHWNFALATAWLVLGLVPPLVFPVMTFMADRYLYAPSLGFCWALAAGIFALSRRFGASRLVRLGVVSVVFGFAMLWFTPRAHMYLQYWRDSETLWRYGTTWSADGRAATGLAAALMENGRYAEAARALEETAVPGVRGHAQLAEIYRRQGRHSEYYREAREAVRELGESPHGPLAAYAQRMLASALWASGRQDEAIAAWEAALASQPGDPNSIRALQEARATRDQAIRSPEVD